MASVLVPIPLEHFRDYCLCTPAEALFVWMPLCNCELWMYIYTYVCTVNGVEIWTTSSFCVCVCGFRASLWMLLVAVYVLYMCAYLRGRCPPWGVTSLLDSCKVLGECHCQSLSLSPGVTSSSQWLFYWVWCLAAVVVSTMSPVLWCSSSQPLEQWCDWRLVNRPWNYPLCESGHI